MSNRENYPGRSTGELVDVAAELLGEIGASVAAYPRETMGVPAQAPELQARAGQQANEWLRSNVPPVTFEHRDVAEPQPVPAAAVQPRSFGELATREIATAEARTATEAAYTPAFVPAVQDLGTETHHDRLARISFNASTPNSHPEDAGFGVN